MGIAQGAGFIVAGRRQWLPKTNRADTAATKQDGQRFKRPGSLIHRKAGQKLRVEKSLPARRNKAPTGDDDESCFGNPSSPLRTSLLAACLLFSVPGAVRAVSRLAALSFCCLVYCLLPLLLLLSPSRSCSVASCSIIHIACSAARPSPGEPRSTKPRVRLLSSLYVRLPDTM